MELYHGSTEDFLNAEAQRQIVSRLQISFFDYYRYQPSESDQRSWHHSLHALAAQIKRSRLLDNGLILEMQLPLTSKRLDCIITGEGENKAQNAALIELKQWTDAAPADEDKCVLVDYGAGAKLVQHPSYQVKYYADYLRDYKTVFYEESPVELHPCAWLHNFQRDPDSTLCDTDKFGTVLQEAPLFAGSDAIEFDGFLKNIVGRGNGMNALDRVLKSRFAPSRKLMEHTARVIQGHPVYVLLDEQRVAFERVMLATKRAVRRRDGREVIIIQGGPGTGKSVIALNAMAELLAMGKNVQHATGSKAFTENLRHALGSRAGTQFRYFNSFVDADEGEIDVLICDEAHRIRESSNSRFTPAAKRSDCLQIDELIRASKVSVFLIDDNQVVRPGEIGSTHLIEDAAAAMGARVHRERLEAQFRCAGSDEYIDWLDALLELRDTDSDELPESGFCFELCDTPDELSNRIEQHYESGESARLTAGFCWKWSDPKDGTLVDDVVVGTFRRPWNAKPDAARLPKGVPKSNYWATDPNGIGQVGCVYTAQGFEFDYVGVIWGNDLVYRAELGGWVGQKAFSFDSQVKRASGELFTSLTKNTYRVLLTRGLKGCLLYVMDPETREYVRARMRQP